ncbi:glycosyltransferase family 4 protein [Paenibacillus thalictri]|uniref:Glycosyltransferase n=1 Tax=Paenibacillus thalictri TaxID=2527873 RepID=A0A4Q9DTF1_9BACL|nr:glycosyltransferase family 4 protein [Paenibacillus thalictri]TBL78642.1 glycosyltransferase [Paenibacillus thalictri]
MICFAILAHNHEDVLANQIENVRKYNPGCKVVVYNGGTDTQFAQSLQVPICPKSRPLKKGRLGCFFMDIMSWLEETGETYDYLVNLDSDVMFVSSGYEDYLAACMQGYDCMGINMGLQKSPDEVPHWYPGQTMWQDWLRWQPFFKTDYFCGTLNSMQVYKHSIISRMMEGLNLDRMEQLIAETKVYALEEMLYATLAVRAGGVPRSYPYKSIEFVRLGESLAVDEVHYAQSKPDVFFVHPIERDMNNLSRQWLSQTRSESYPKSLTVIWACHQGGMETAIHHRLAFMNHHLNAEAHAFFYYGGAGLSNFNSIPYHISNKQADLVAYLKKHQFDTVTFVNTIHNLDALEKAGFQGKAVFEFHGINKFILQELDRINTWKDRGIIQGIVVPSDYVAEVAHQYLGNRKEIPVYVARNVLNTTFFHRKNEVETSYFIRVPQSWANCPVIGWVGRLDANKNWKLLLKVFSEFKKLNASAKLLIVSDITTSPHLNLFYKRACSYGLINDIRVLPNLSYDKMPYYYSLLVNSGGILLSTSYSEGYPYSLLEAQACECPIVCSDIRGNTEVIAHGESGLTFPIANHHTAVSLVYALTTNKNLRKMIAEGAPKHIHLTNNVHKNVSEYAAWLKRLSAT